MNHLKFILTFAVGLTLSAVSFGQTTKVYSKGQGSVTDPSIEWLEIRKMPLDINLKDNLGGEKEAFNAGEGVMVYKCYKDLSSRDEYCEPLVNEIVTLAELREALIYNNLAVGSFSLGLGVIGVLFGGGVVLGTGITAAAFLKSMGFMKFMGFFVGGTTTFSGLFTLGQEFGKRGAGATMTNGSRLRKLLSKKDILFVKNLDKLEQSLIDLIHRIVDNR